MAALTITAADVRMVELWVGYTRPAGEALTPAQYSRPNTTTGLQELGNSTTAGEVGNVAGLPWNSVAVNETTTFMVHGIMELGSALDSLNFDDPVYLNDTDGVLGDAAGTVSTIVGYVIPGFANTTADKLLYVDLR